MVNVTFITRRYKETTYSFVCERTTNSRDGQPRLTVRVFGQVDGRPQGQQLSAMPMPGMKQDKQGRYIMLYKFEGDDKQYNEFADMFLSKVKGDA